MNEKLHTPAPVGEKPWMKHFGALSKLRKETRRIEAIIEREFETMDRDEHFDLVPDLKRIS